MSDDTSAPQQEQAPGLDAEAIKQIMELRTVIRQNYAQAVMVMSAIPRYRNQMIGDLNHLVMDPMLRDRLTFAYKGTPDDSGAEPELAGFAIWANVSAEVDARIRDQIKGGVFPIRLKAEDWTSGDIIWLLDVVAPDPKMTSSVVANFSHVVQDGKELRLHPGVVRMVDPELLQKMGARKAEQPADE